MKQVLVIDKDTVEEYVTKFSVDDIERDAIEHFIKHHNPGNLLASFEGELEIRTKGSGYGRVITRRIDDIAALRPIWKNNPNVTVLILEEK